MTQQESQVTAIIAAYNEEPTLGPIVRLLVGSGVFKDVIVVTDGSTDRSPEVAREAGASLVLHHAMKQGKGHALKRATDRATSPYIYFFDADLYGLKLEHIPLLLEPVIQGKVDMMIGLHDRGRILSWLMQYLPLIGGERVLPKKAFDALPEKYLEGYRIEISLNQYCLAHGMTIGTRVLKGVRIRRKMQKFGLWRGLYGYCKMTYEMIDAFVMSRAAIFRGKY